MIARALLLTLFSLGGTAAASAARALAEGDAFSTDIAPPELSPGELAGRIIGAVVLLCFSALFSGLTLGLLSLETNQLQILVESGTPDERRHAAAILPVRKRGNLLLCTLVTGNVAVVSLESILLADLTSGLVGFVLTTVLTVVFGEIIPQAVCNRHGLVIGARCVPLVTFIIYVFYPLTAPLAAMLDHAFGEELGHLYSKSEFLTLVKMHLASKKLDKREAGIISGAVTYRDKKVRDHMTPAARMFALSEGDRLDFAAMSAVFRAGFSRIPVWDAARATWSACCWPRTCCCSRRCSATRSRPSSRTSGAASCSRWSSRLRSRSACRPSWPRTSTSPSCAASTPPGRATRATTWRAS